MISILLKIPWPIVGIPQLSKTTVIFHDFPGLETPFLNFMTFQDVWKPRASVNIIIQLWRACMNPKQKLNSVHVHAGLFSSEIFGEKFPEGHSNLSRNLLTSSLSAS